jgi:hypothetical protein
MCDPAGFELLTKSTMEYVISAHRPLAISNR